MNSCDTRRCDWGELLLVTSAGDAPNWHADYMGLYQVMSVNYNSAPAYRQVHNVIATKSYYLYKYDTGAWHVSDELGDSGGGLFNSNTSPAPPRSGWQYWEVNIGEDRADPNLSIVTISDTSTRICPIINISARGAAARKVPDYLGRFTITNQFSAGRPVYRNNRGKYLRVLPGTPDWSVSDNVVTDDQRIWSGAAAGLCPASDRSRYNKRRNINSWQYWDNGWRDGDITVTCTDPNIICDL